MAEGENAGGDAATKKDKKRKDIILNRDFVIKKLNHRHQDRKPSPLVTLQEIFEETPDKSRFVGDTMFWKYFEDINTERIKHTTSVEFRNLRVMCWETIFYVLLLFCFTYYVFTLRSLDVNDARMEQKNYWAGCDTTGKCNIDDVEDMSSFWNWMQTELVPRAYDNGGFQQQVANILTPFQYNDFPLHWVPRFVGPQGSNVLLGSIRVRQLRVVKNMGCTVSVFISHVYPDCYGGYNPSYKSTEDYAPRFAPTYLRPAFIWKSQEETRQVEVLGAMSRYSGDGFTIDLPFNQTQSATMVNDLYRWHWVDRSSRAIIIELSTMNVNVDVIVNTRIIFEFGPTGSVRGKVTSDAARVFFFTPSTQAGSALAMYILQLMVFVVFTIYTVWTLYLMFKTCQNFLGEHPLDYLKKSTVFGALSFLLHTLYHYFRYGWNLVDLVIIVLFYTHMFYRMATYAIISVEPSLQPDVIGHPEKFMPFSRVMVPHKLGTSVLSLLALFCWAKLFKYLCMSGLFRLLIRIIESTAKKLVKFILLLVIVFFGFAVAFFCGFGSTEEYFTSVTGAFLVLNFLLIDGYDLDGSWFQPGRDQVMPMIFFLYIAVIYFVILNIFVAITLDVYATSEHLSRDASEKRKRLDSKHPEDAEGKKNPMAVFLWTYFNWMRGVSLVRNDTEENMRSEDLSIKLTLLPGIVRKKWIEKKRNLQRVAHECFAGMELFPEDGEALKSADHLMIKDWMLPSSRADVLEKMSRNSSGKPVAIYDIPSTLMQQEVSRAQLQRLMDEDETMPLLLGTKKAVEVIRKFKQEHADQQAVVKGNDMQDVGPVKGLQGDVFARIDQLEKVGLDEDVLEVPEITELTESMSHAITDIRNQFRIQLTGVIEATAVLFEHLVELTQGIDAIRENHEQVLEMVDENSGDYDGDDGSER